MPRQAPAIPALVVLAALLASCSSPVSRPELTAFYGVFPSDEVFQDAEGTSTFTPRFRIVAAGAYAPRVERISELVIAGPEGESWRTGAPSFQPRGTDLVTFLEGEPRDTPLPRGEWELLIRFDDGELLLARTSFDDEPLGPVEVVEVRTESDGRPTLRWTGPGRPFDWFSRVVRTAPAPSVLVTTGPGGVDLGTGGTRATTFPVDLRTLDPEARYAAMLVLETSGTVRTVFVPLELP